VSAMAPTKQVSLNTNAVATTPRPAANALISQLLALTLGTPEFQRK
jgi:hypothetical protein